MATNVTSVTTVTGTPGNETTAAPGCNCQGSDTRQRAPCSDDFPSTNELYSDLPAVDAVFLSVCGLLTIVTVAIFASQLWGHHYRFKRDPRKRMKTLILLGLYPMTSFLSSFALFIPKSTVLVDLLASCYLSLCIYVFISILIQYYGDRKTMIETLSKDKVAFRSPPCCCCCFCCPVVTLSRRTLLILRTMIMQVAILQPLLVFLKAVIWAEDHNVVNQTTGLTPFLVINLLSGVSTVFSLYGLQVTVRASQTALEKYWIRAKFLLLQFVLIFTNLQTAIFGIFIRYDMPACQGLYGTKIRASVIHHMMVIGEMVLLSVIARWVYRKSEFRQLSEYRPCQTQGVEIVTDAKECSVTNQPDVPGTQTTSGKLPLNVDEKPVIVDTET